MYYKIIEGKKVYSDCRTISLNGCDVSNPTPEQIAAAGWIEVVIPAPTPAELLERAKQGKIMEIEAYNESTAVNEWYLNGQPMQWLNPTERMNYRQTLQDLKAAGQTTITWWGITMDIDKCIECLVSLNIYALEATAVTETHKANVMLLESVEAVEAYDYTQGYPEKRRFVYE